MKSVSFYPEKINARFQFPKFAGEAGFFNAEGIEASFSCGSAVTFFLCIEPESKQIISANFRTSGCGYMSAASDLLAEKVTGKRLVELHGLHDDVIKGWLKAELGDFPAARRDCLNVSIAALHSALADFRIHRIEEWKGEKALICTCFGVSEETIESAIGSRSLQTVDEVTGACNAGGGCGSCQPLIQDILDSVCREMI